MSNFPKPNGKQMPTDLIRKAALAVIAIDRHTPDSVREKRVTELIIQCTARKDEFLNVGQKKLDSLCVLVMQAMCNASKSWDDGVIAFVVNHLTHSGRPQEEACAFIDNYIQGLPWQLGWQLRVKHCPLHGREVSVDNELFRVEMDAKLHEHLSKHEMPFGRDIIPPGMFDGEGGIGELLAMALMSGGLPGMPRMRMPGMFGMGMDFPSSDDEMPDFESRFGEPEGSRAARDANRRDGRW